MISAEILLVDDEPDILALGLNALREAGYSVQTAISGDVAAILIEQGLMFDLLITDIVMPGSLDGYGLAARVRELIPRLPIIYSTGYTRATARAIGAPDGRFLIKPWRQGDLI